MPAFLLAAGHGRRAGGPKAWRLHEGRTLLERQVDFLVSRLGAENVFVSIQPAWLARCRAVNADVHWIAADPDAPAFSSLRALLSASPRDAWTSLHHVDMPVWEPALFDALERRARVSSADAVAPRFEGRRGHPVLLSPRAQRELVGPQPGAERLDAWLRGRAVDEVEVPFGCARQNWNTAAAR